MKRFLLIALFVFVLSFVLFPALPYAMAQDTGGMPPALNPVFDIPDPQAVLMAIVDLLIRTFVVVAASPLTSGIVAALKRVPPFNNMAGETVNFLVVAALVLVIWLSKFLGVEPQLNTVFQVILALSGVFLSLGYGARASATYYESTTKGKVKFLGNATTP